MVRTAQIKEFTWITVRDGVWLTTDEIQHKDPQRKRENGGERCCHLLQAADPAQEENHLFTHARQSAGAKKGFANRK